MRRLTITMLSLTLVLLGLQQGQAKDMDNKMGKSDDHSMTQPLQADDMKMQHDDTNMQSDAMMKNNEIKTDHVKMNAMKMEQTMIPTDTELRQRLTPLQYKVTRENGTEQPFANPYWDNHEPGIYVDIISGAPLFSSTDKYESGTGWPSFSKPLNPAEIVEKVDRGLFSVRTEIRSKQADAHLGHVFSDGPAPTGLRYCMNSAALRFIPQADLVKEGYAEYEQLFR